MMIELTDTNSAGIAAEFVRARTRAGSPAMGMVMTHGHRRRRGRRRPMRWTWPGEASHEHPARVLGVILGDGRGRRAGQRPGRQRRRLERRDRPDPADRRGGQAPRVGGAAAAAARLPRRRLVADRRRRRIRPRTRSGSWPSDGSPTRPRLARARPRRCTPSARPTPRATPTWPGPGSRRGARCWPPPSTSTRSRSPAATVTAERISPSADLLVAWLRRPAQGRRGPQELRGPGITEVVLETTEGPIRDRPPRRPAGDLHLARPARPPGRAQAPRGARAALPRSCAASTRTTSTPRSPRR